MGELPSFKDEDLLITISTPQDLSIDLEKAINEIVIDSIAKVKPEVEVVCPKSDSTIPGSCCGVEIQLS
eukprot:7486284-Prorocentrum_lima.AAC.1